MSPEDGKSLSIFISFSLSLSSLCLSLSLYTDSAYTHLGRWANSTETIWLIPNHLFPLIVRNTNSRLFIFNFPSKFLSLFFFNVSALSRAICRWYCRNTSFAWALLYWPGLKPNLRFSAMVSAWMGNGLGLVISFLEGNGSGWNKKEEGNELGYQEEWRREVKKWRMKNWEMKPLSVRGRRAIITQYKVTIVFFHSEISALTVALFTTRRHKVQPCRGGGKLKTEGKGADHTIQGDKYMSNWVISK